MCRRVRHEIKYILYYKQHVDVSAVLSCHTFSFWNVQFAKYLLEQ